MGTEASLEIYSRDRDGGLNQLEQFLAIMEKTEGELTTWREESAISRLNTSSVGVDLIIEAGLCRLFGELVNLHTVSHGSFDPAIGRLLATWDMHGTARLPSSTELETARSESGLHLLGFSSKQCLLTKHKDIHLDSGAFGKGEALDRVKGYSKGVNSDPWLINLGGQVAVYGLPPGREGWKVKLSSPVDREQCYMTVQLTKGSVATSGNSERTNSINGVEVGHILDPRTGRPSKFSGSVTVWHQDALYADALSTALHVMGPAEGIEWADLHEIAVCFSYLSESGQIESRRNPYFDPLVSQ
jgi:thiamine biosynthesis lipoprotein